MSYMVTRNRVSNAFRAMKNIGISENKVKPVLKKLLKLYDKNWELIEAENYRALADAIFESDETEVSKPPQKIQSSEAAEHSKNIVNYEEGDEMEDEAQERPLKRLRRTDRNGQTSSKRMSDTGMTRTPLIMPKEEPNELPETAAENIGVKSQPAICQLDKNKGKQPINPDSLIVHERGDSVQSSGVSKSQQNTPSSSEPRSLVHPMRLRERGKGSTFSQISPKVRRPATESSSHDARLKEPKIEPDIVLSPEQKTSACPVLTKPKDEPISEDMPLPKAPIAVIPPEPLNGDYSSNDDGTIREDNGSKPTSHSENQLEKVDGTSYSKESRNNGKLAKPSANASVCNGIDYGSQPNKRAAGGESGPGTKKQEICAEQANKSLVIVQQTQVTPEMIGSVVVDIAKGQEKVVITLVNDVNNESPPSFHYIPKNAIFQDAYVNVSLARIGDSHCCSTCVGDCLSLETPCVCSYESGGEFAYTADGLVKEELLKESISMNRDPKKHCQFFCKECPLERSKNEDTIEPCKGHLVRKFIKECWLKCGCNKLCGNRVVQRGISRKLQVFMTPEGKGWGLRTLEDLPRGAFVCEYVGEVLTNAELFDRVLRKSKGEKHSYPVLLDADWCAEGVLKDEDALCLDATHYGNVARFINHRCYDSTMVEIPVEVETPDHHYYHLAFFTTRKVKAMEELTWDYGIDFDDIDHPIKAFRCQCGSKFCRNIKRSRFRGARRG